jgi:putative transposase
MHGSLGGSTLPPASSTTGAFYYLCSILDGCSPINRQLGSARVDDGGGHRDYPAAGQELHPEARPRIISDKGPQFIAQDFKEFIRISGMTHVRTSPYYPQSNGKI